MESMQFYDRLKMIIRGCQHGRVKTPELKSLTLVTHRATNTIQYNAITYCCQNQSKTGRLKPPDMSITALTPLLCAYLMSSQPGPHHVSQTSYCPPSYNKTRSSIVRVQLQRRKLLRGSVHRPLQRCKPGDFNPHSPTVILAPLYRA